MTESAGSPLGLVQAIHFIPLYPTILFHHHLANTLAVFDGKRLVRSVQHDDTYLSPIIDCFDGMPISWAISTSPSAEMANSSLLGACSQLKEGEHPTGHSDRGCHYRWPGWIGICDNHGIVRSMSRKGCSPDNARAEGFFGRLKVEFFYGRDWSGVSLDEFADMLDAYLRWYRDVRLKSDLGYKSPMQYRRDLGLIA